MGMWAVWVISMGGVVAMMGKSRARYSRIS